MTLKILKTSLKLTETKATVTASKNYYNFFNPVLDDIFFFEKITGRYETWRSFFYQASLCKMTKNISLKTRSIFSIIRENDH